MFHAAISAYKFVSANWRIIAIAGVLAGVFSAGWCVRGYIAEAVQNKAIAAAVAETKKQEKESYEKAQQLEKALAESRARERKLAIGLDKELRSNNSYRICIVPDGGVQLYNEAIRGNITSELYPAMPRD